MKDSLIIAVLDQLGGASRETIQEAIDAANHGADGGWPGFSYYQDTENFFINNKRDILDLAREMSDEMGYGSVGEMIAGFRCLQQYPDFVDDPMFVLGTGIDHEDFTVVANAMAWFALEEVGRHLSDMDEDDIAELLGEEEDEEEDEDDTFNDEQDFSGGIVIEGSPYLDTDQDTGAV